jgi:hypothetical protein
MVRAGRDWVDGRSDPQIVAAVRYLKNSDAAYVPRLDRIRVTAIPPLADFVFHGRVVNGCGRLRDRAARSWSLIQVDPRSPQYQKALAGDCRPLSALLLHEEVHVRDSRDDGSADREARAYSAQIRYLLAQDVDRDDLDEARLCAASNGVTLESDLCYEND